MHRQFCMHSRVWAGMQMMAKPIAPAVGAAAAEVVGRGGINSASSQLQACPMRYQGPWNALWGRSPTNSIRDVGRQLCVIARRQPPLSGKGLQGRTPVGIDTLLLVHALCRFSVLQGVCAAH